VGDRGIRAVKKAASIYVQHTAADASFATRHVYGSAGGSGQP
jgi:hypothetical protein